MRFKTLRRWQWVVIGILVGGAVGWASLQMGGVGATPVGMSQEEFERLLVTPPAMGQYPALDEVTVVPVDGVYWVRAMRRYPLADGSGFEYRARWLALHGLHYQPLAGSDHGADYTVRDFLADTARTRPALRYRYAWERDPRFALPACILGGALLIGGVWPWALGAGARAKEPPYDLSRFSPQPAAAQPTRTDNPDVLPARQPEQLAPTDQLAPSAAPPSLTAGPLEDPSHQPPKEHKQYDGEFYPTETHAHRNPH